MELHSSIFGVYTPGIEAIDVDNLCLEAFRTCEMKYFRQIVQGLVSNEEGAALAFGRVIHAARAMYRTTKTDSKATPEFCLELGLGALENEWNVSMPAEMKTDLMANDKRSLANAKRLFKGYHDKYLQHGEPLAVELVDGRYLGKSPEFGIEVYYHYAMDELCLFDGRKYTREVKTHSSMFKPGPSDLLQFQTSSAIKGYVWAAEQHFAPETISGAIVDLIWVHAEPKKETAKSVPLKDYFLMDLVYPSQDAIELWKQNTLITVDDIVRCSNRGVYKYDFGKACTLYGKCPYYDIHAADSSSWDAVIQEGYKVKRWNPYER